MTTHTLSQIRFHHNFLCLFDNVHYGLLLFHGDFVAPFAAVVGHDVVSEESHLHGVVVVPVAVGGAVVGVVRVLRGRPEMPAPSRGRRMAAFAVIGEEPGQGSGGLIGL